MDLSAMPDLQMPDLQMGDDIMEADSDKCRARFARYESLFRDDRGEIKEPVGQTCSRLLCFQVENAEDHLPRPCLFWLSVLEGNYYRFFIDIGAYIVQWFRADAALFEEELREEQHTPMLDLSELYGLRGQKIVNITVERAWQDRLYLLRLEYAGDETLMEVA